MGGKDHNGFNIGVFFLRVHDWSVTMLSATLAFQLVHPEIDLGNSADQTAMNYVCNQTDFRPNVLYQPRPWYNTYEFTRGYEGEKGNLLVHFPGLEAERFIHMRSWLDIVEKNSSAWEIPLTQTAYQPKIDEFWATLRKGRDLVQSIAQDPSVADWANLQQAIERLKTVLEEETDRLPAVVEAIEAVTAARAGG